MQRMHGFQSSSCCVELGDRRVLQSEVENKQCLRHLVGRAHYIQRQTGPTTMPSAFAAHRHADKLGRLSVLSEVSRMRIVFIHSRAYTV